MEYAIIVICIVAVAATVLIYNKQKNDGTAGTPKNSGSILAAKKNNLFPKHDMKPGELAVQIEMLPVGSIPDECNLTEIRDRKVLTQINNLIPGFVQADITGNNAIQAAKAGNEVVYRAIIPAGARLTRSKTMEGAVRGIYHGASKIQGNANFIATEAPKGSAVSANAAAATMSVAAIIVGQYYMTQINAGLQKISDDISKISDFLSNEFRSRVFSLIAHVKRIADFQVEILENNELRLPKIIQLDRLEEECTGLLGQANLTLVGYSKKKELNYRAYEKELNDAHNWHTYQKALFDVLYKISDLRYTLYFGAVSREQCGALLPTYTKQVSDTQEMLTVWHQDTTKRLNIDTGKEQRKRTGFDGVIHFLPSLLGHNPNFRSISNATARMITEQSASQTIHPDTTELYAQDVQLILKSGKIYYLPGGQGRIEQNKISIGSTTLCFNFLFYAIGNNTGSHKT